MAAVIKEENLAQQKTVAQQKNLAHNRLMLRIQKRKQQMIARKNSPIPEPELKKNGFKIIRNFIDPATVKRCSEHYRHQVETRGNDYIPPVDPDEGPGTYGYREWDIQKTYMLQGVPEDPLMGPAFDPIIEKATREFKALGVGDVYCDSAFGQFYDAMTEGVETGANWGEHRDYCSDDRLAYVSAIVQGYTREGYVGGSLKFRDNGDDNTWPEGEKASNIAHLSPGDAVLLREAFHHPGAITSGKRIAFVFFFSAEKSKQRITLEKEKEKESAVKGGGGGAIVTKNSSKSDQMGEQQESSATQTSNEEDQHKENSV